MSGVNCNSETFNWLREIVYVDSEMQDGKIGDYEIYSMLYQKLIEEEGRDDVALLRFDHHGNICGIQDSEKRSPSDTSKFTRFSVLLVGTAVIPGLTKSNTHHAVLVIDREKKTYTYLNSYFGGVSPSIIEKCNNIGLIDKSFTSFSVASTLQMDFWSCGLQVIENVSRFFDYVDKGVAYKHRTFTRGSVLSKKYTKLFNRFAQSFGGRLNESIEARNNRFIKLGVRRALKLFNADQDQHPLHGFFIFFNKQVLENVKSLNQLVEDYLKDRVVGDLERKFLEGIASSNLDKCVFNSHYECLEFVSREIKKQIYVLLSSSNDSLVADVVKHVPGYIIQSSLDVGQTLVIEKSNLTKKINANFELVLGELDACKEQLGGMPNFKGIRPPMHDQADFGRYFFNRSMVAWKDYLRFVVKNKVKPIWFWKKISKYFNVDVVYSDYESISQAIQKLIQLIHNRDEIFQLLDSYERGVLSLDEMHSNFGKLSGGLGWHPNQNCAAVEKEYIDFIGIFLNKDFNIAKKEGKLIEYFQSFNGVCFEDIIKGCLKWRENNSILQQDNNEPYYESDQIPEIFMGKVLEKNRESSLSFCEALEKRHFFEKDFLVDKIKQKPTLEIVQEFIVNQQRLCTLPWDTMDVVLARQLEIIKSRNLSEDVAKSAFVKSLKNLIGSQSEFYVKVGDKDVELVWSDSIEQQAISFFRKSFSSPSGE